MEIRSYKDLKVWQHGIGLVKEVYTISKLLPANERYGLVSQMQRAAISIPSNIAEGYARKGTVEYIQFLSVAYGSAAELETQLIIVSQQYSTANVERSLVLADEIQKMLYSLINKLKVRASTPLPSILNPIS